MAKIHRIITCEHASLLLPERYIDLFDNPAILKTHQGWDIGASSVATAIAEKFSISLHLAQYSRLLIDLNRSLTHPQLFSHPIRALTKLQKQEIIDEYYSPYRNKIVAEMHQSLQQGDTVQHISVHSFTPILKDVPRHCDVGLLYDPSRNLEKNLVTRWQKLLKKSGMNVRLNYPYRGVSDGFVTYLRKINSPERYQGVELEINQSLFDHDGNPLNDIIDQILAAFDDV